MAKTFEGRYFKGSLLDWVGGLTPTNNGTTLFKQTDKGYALSLNGTNQWISYTGSAVVKSVIIFLKTNGLSKDIIDFDGGTHSIEVGAANITATGFASPTIYLDAIASAAMTDKKWKCLIVTTNTSFTANAIKIGKETSYLKGEVAYVAFENTVLTQQEIDAYQAMFESLKQTAKAKRNFIGPDGATATAIKLREDFSDTPVGGFPREFQRGTGTYTCQEHSMAKGELVPLASSTFDTDGSSFWISIRSSITWNTDTKDITILTTSDGEVRIQRAAMLTVGKNYRMSWYAKSSTATNQMSVGETSTARYIKRPNLTSEYQQYIAEFTSLGGYAQIICHISATIGTIFSIDNISIVEIPPLPHIKDGYKFLRCDVAGTIAFPSEFARGKRFEFDVFKGADNNDLVVSLVSDRIGGYIANIGYFFTLSSTERVGVYKNTIGSATVLLYSAVSYITINTFYRVRIDVTATTFTVYLKGGALTATAGCDGWHRVSTTGGSGSNPATDSTYSTSKFFVLDLDALDRVGNIVISEL